MSYVAVTLLALAGTLSAAPVKKVPVKARVETLSLDECLKSKPCLALIEIGFNQVYPLHLKEAEGAMPDRFFKGALTFALREPDAGGHFLKVVCAANPRQDPSPCASYRDPLEERLLSATLLQALPIGIPKPRLYDGETWVPTALGKACVAKVKNEAPELWDRLLPKKR